MNRETLWQILRPLLTLTILGLGGVWLITSLNWGELWSTLRGAEWAYLLPSTLLSILTYFLLGYRWQHILGKQPRYIDTVSAFQVGVYANLVLPLRVGDLTRSYLIHRRVPTLPTLTVLTSIGTGLMLDMSSLILILPLLLILFPLPPVLTVASLVVTGVTGLVALLFFTLARQKELLPKRLIQAGWLAQIQGGVQILASNKATIQLMGLTVVSYGIQGVANWLLLLALTDDALLVSGFISMLGAAIGLAVPLLPGSLGTYEAAITLALSSAGIDPETAALASVMFRWQQVLIIATLGSLFMVREGVNFADLRQLAQTPLPYSPPPTVH